MHVDYEGRMGSVYQAGRSLSHAVTSLWVDAAARHIDEAIRGVVCDLGSGTGRFSGELAARLGTPVVAVEPSAKMRAQARVAMVPNVWIVAGNAEQIPLRPSTCKLVWMSQSIHHVSDLDACALELRRVLVEGGRVMLRGLFDIHRGVLDHFFPGASAIAETRFPSLSRITETFERAGLPLLAHELVTQTIAGSAAELLERTRHRADSTLELLPDVEFEVGLAQLAEAAHGGELSEPVVEDLDLVVFAR